MSECQREMPRYRCHKQVWALKIAGIEQPAPNINFDGGSWDLMPEDEGYGPVRVSHEWYTKHSPQVGGYYVVYKDGYASYSPADAFDSGYKPEQTEFRNHLAAAINRNSKEGGSNTPDFILANYLADCLEAFDRAAQRRREWYTDPNEGQVPATLG